MLKRQHEEEEEEEEEEEDGDSVMEEVGQLVKTKSKSGRSAKAPVVPLKYRKMPTAYPTIQTAVDKVFSIEEMITYIMQFVPASDKLRNLRTVCKDWNNAVCDSASWHSLRLTQLEYDNEESICEMFLPEARLLLTQLRVIDVQNIRAPHFDFRDVPFLESCTMSLSSSMLAQVLTVLPKLTHLSISWNCTVSEQAAYTSLANMSKLRSLRWDDESQLSSRFANAFGQSLPLLESYEGILTLEMLKNLTEHCPPHLHSLSYRPSSRDGHTDATDDVCGLLEVVGPQLTGTLRLCVEQCDVNMVMWSIYQHCAAISELHIYNGEDGLQDPCIGFLLEDKETDDDDAVTTPHYPRLKVLVIETYCVEDHYCADLARQCPALTTLKIAGALTGPCVVELSKGLSQLAVFCLNLAPHSEQALGLDTLYFLASSPNMRYFELDHWYCQHDGMTNLPFIASRSSAKSNVDFIRKRLCLPPLICIAEVES
jgi:hypothetical protein